MITTDDSLNTLRTLVDRPEVFVADGILTVGVPLGTDAFVSAYVAATCQEITADIDPRPPRETLLCIEITMRITIPVCIDFD